MDCAISTSVQWQGLRNLGNTNLEESVLEGFLHLKARSVSQGTLMS